MLRDSLPKSNILFVEVCRSRAPCWRVKVGESRRHFSFKRYGGLLEGRLRALDSEFQVIPHFTASNRDVPHFTASSTDAFSDPDEFMVFVAEGVPLWSTVEDPRIKVHRCIDPDRFASTVVGEPLIGEPLMDQTEIHEF